MSTSDILIERIEKHCARAGISPKTFGRKVVNDGKLISRLKSGGSITLDTFAKLEAALDEGEATAADFMESGEAV